MQPESPSATESTAAARHEERTESARLRDAAGPVRALKREAPMAAPVMQSAAAPDAAPRVGAAALASRGDSSAAAKPAMAGRPAPWRAVRTQGAVANWVAMESLRPPDADWLDRLEALAHSGWQSTLEATPAPGASLLRWQLAGLSVGRLWLEDGAALWCGRALPCQRAPVQSQALRALLAELAR